MHPDRGLHAFGTNRLSVFITGEAVPSHWMLCICTETTNRSVHWTEWTVFCPRLQTGRHSSSYLFDPRKCDSMLRWLEQCLCLCSSCLAERSRRIEQRPRCPSPRGAAGPAPVLLRLYNLSLSISYCVCVCVSCRTTIKTRFVMSSPSTATRLVTSSLLVTSFSLLNFKGCHKKTTHLHSLMISFEPWVIILYFELKSDLWISVFLHIWTLLFGIMKPKVTEGLMKWPSLLLEAALLAWG